MCFIAQTSLVTIRSEPTGIAQGDPEDMLQLPSVHGEHPALWRVTKEHSYARQVDCNDAEPGSHAFEQRDGHSFVPRPEDDCVMLGEHGSDVVPVAEVAHTPV